MKEKLSMAKAKVLAISSLTFLAPLSAMAQWTNGFNKANQSLLPKGRIVDIITRLMFWLLIILGAIAIIGFVISGILYLTSAGDEERMEKAKRGMIYSIIGVIVALMGFIIVQAVNTWLSGQNSEF